MPHILPIPEILHLPLVAALVASVACGIVGTLTVVRHNTYVAGAVSHSVLAGLGFAQFAAVVLGWAWFSPTLGAMIAAVAAALVIARFRSRNASRPDTVLSAVWSVGMALGLVFMAATPGYQNDLMNYLFGTILLVAESDIATMLALDAVIVLAVAVCWRGILSVCFNPEAAKLHGVSTGFFETVISVLTAIAIVLLVRIVGIVLVIALLTIPSIAAGCVTRRLVPMMTASVTITFVSIAAGLAVSYVTDFPPAALIVLCAAVIALVFGGIAKLKKSV